MDSKFCGLIAYIIYCLSKNFDKMNEVIVLDNTTNNILLFNSVYDAKNQKYRIMDYIRNSVVVGENCEFYKDISWGSEPYLIKIGNNVRITSGCKFVTHDGGVWVLRNKKKLPLADIFGMIKIANNCTQLCML